MKHAGYHGYLRSKCIRLSHRGIRHIHRRSSNPPGTHPPRILQGVSTNLAMTRRNER